MKTLTAAEALRALVYGEKVTSDLFDEDKKYLSYIHIKNGIIEFSNGEDNVSLDDFIESDNFRIYEEFTYPMWFENVHNEKILKFKSLQSGTYPDGSFSDVLIAHTYKDTWKQVEEPKKKIKIYKFAVFKESWYETSDYYLNASVCLKSHSLATLAKRLDYTEIEVEEY